MVFLIYDKESALISRVNDLETIIARGGGPAGGGIYVAGDDSNAFEFQIDRAGFRR